MKTFKLEIVTPEKTVFSEDAESLIIPAEEGYLGVMAHHAPLLCSIKIGVVFVKKAGGVRLMTTSGGFLEFLGNTATVLVETCERPGEIDLRRAEEALARAKDRMKPGLKEVDFDRARAALMRALNRLKLAEKANK